MARKRVDLKKRLDTLRNVPQPPVPVLLQLDASLLKSLTKLASEQEQSVERYVEQLLQKHVKNRDG